MCLTHLLHTGVPFPLPFTMAAMLSRLYTALIAPPVVEKKKDAVRFGILGAAKVA